MTEAVFQACFTDWRLIKGRKCVQIALEVPIEGADLAYQALGGMPDPSKSVWCAVARLEDTAGVCAPESAVERVVKGMDPSSFITRSLAQTVGATCSRPLFHRFLSSMYPDRWKILNNGTDEERAAVIVRSLCCVKSRADIESSPEATQLWHDLENRYLAWQRDAPF